MTAENISWSNLHKRMLPTWRGSNPLPPDHQTMTRDSIDVQFDLSLCLMFMSKDTFCQVKLKLI